MTSLAEQPPTTVGWVVKPMIGGQRSCVHAVKEIDRLAARPDVLAKGDGQGRPPPVEPHDDRLTRLVAGITEGLQLVIGQARGFLDEDRLAAAHRRLGERGMRGMTASDGDEMGARVRESLVDSGCPDKAKPVSG